MRPGGQTVMDLESIDIHKAQKISGKYLGMRGREDGRWS